LTWDAEENIIGLVVKNWGVEMKKNQLLSERGLSDALTSLKEPYN
jgi:hypothetical protein